MLIRKISDIILIPVFYIAIFYLAVKYYRGTEKLGPGLQMLTGRNSMGTFAPYPNGSVDEPEPKKLVTKEEKDVKYTEITQDLEDALDFIGTFEEQYRINHEGTRNYKVGK